MRRFTLYLLVLVSALAFATPRICRDRYADRLRICETAAAAGSGDIVLAGRSINISHQCDAGTPVYSEAPVQRLIVSRASAAYCTRDDGLLVLVPDSTVRVERAGVLIEEASANDVTAPRDCSGVSWVKANTTCTKTAVGADGVTDSASTLTATATNGTALTIVTALSATRSTSMYLKRRTGTGAVSVTRNNGTNYVDVASELSTTTWKRVRNGCGGFGASASGPDYQFARLDNCIDVPGMKGAVVNPTIGLKLGTSGDAVDIDFVQDEALAFTSSPMSGFARAKDSYSIALDGGLPFSQGELSVDMAVEYTTAEPAASSIVMIDTGNTGTQEGVTLALGRADGAGLGVVWRNGVASGLVSSGSGYPVLPGNAKNYRLTWGSGSSALWNNGVRTAVDATTTSPTGHNAYAVGQSAGAIQQLDGWLTRVRWTSGTYANFLGSNRAVSLQGDSIVVGSYSSEGAHPPQILSSLLGGMVQENYISVGAVAGNTIDQCRTSWDATVTALQTQPGKDRFVLFMQCGTNSLAEGAQAVHDKLVAGMDIARDGGVRSFVGTITPRGTNTQAITDTNNLLRTTFAARGWPLAETEHALEFPADSGVLNPIYDIGDALHVNDAGSGVMTLVWYNTGRDAGYF